MSHRIHLGIALALALTAASLGLAPTQASRMAQAIADRNATRDVLALAPTGPVTDACFTEYTGDGATDFSSVDAQALRNALAAVAPGGTVKVAGTCAGAILQDGSTQVALVTTTLSLVGGYTPTDWANSYPLTQPTTLDALGAGRVLYFSGVDGVVANLMVQNGDAPTDNGGGLYASKSITLTQVSVIRNTTQYDGGGLFAAGSAAIFSSLFISNTTTPAPNGYGSGGGAYVKDSAVLESVRFEQNRSAYFGGGLEIFTGTTVISDTQFFTNLTVLTGGGVYVNRGVAHVVNSLFTNNQVSEYSGGGLEFHGSALTVTNSSFLSNTVHGACGGFGVAYGMATVIGGRFQGNVASTGDGGGLCALELTMRGTELIGNTAQRSGGGASTYGVTVITGGLFEDNRALTCVGGGLFTSNRYYACSFSYPPTLSTLVMTGTRFVGNTAQQYGGGVFAESTVTFAQTEFVSNTAQLNAGGVWAIGAITITGGLFQANQVHVYGAGGLLAHNRLSMNGTRFVGNTAALYAGGADVLGSANIVNGLFQENMAYSGPAGGLDVAGSLALTGTQFLGNVATVGGGLWHSGSSGRIANALFSRNVATTTLGAAMYLSSTGAVAVLHSTIASPTLGGGAAIFIVAGTVRLTDTLIASYTVGISNAGGTVSENYTLFNGVTTPRAGAVGVGANSFTGTAQFVSPASDNYHLALGSAAINAGVNAGVFLDFEGTSRPFGGGFDIGYDEWGVSLRAYLPKVWR